MQSNELCVALCITQALRESERTNTCGYKYLCIMIIVCIYKHMCTTKNVCIAHADKVRQSLRKVLGNATRKNCRSGKHWQGQKFPSPSESASSGVFCSADLTIIFPVPSLVPGLQNARTQHRGGSVWFEQDAMSGLRSVSCSNNMAWRAFGQSFFLVRVKRDSYKESELESYSKVLAIL